MLEAITVLWNTCINYKTTYLFQRMIFNYLSLKYLSVLTYHETFTGWIAIVCVTYVKGQYKIYEQKMYNWIANNYNYHDLLFF